MWADGPSAYLGATAMSVSPLVDQYLNRLLVGDRAGCRAFIQEQIVAFEDLEPLYYDLLWPVMEQVDRLYRSDRINLATEHMATRINRAMADQVQLRLPARAPTGKKVVVTCADGEPEELGAQMCADLLESRGWEVYFLGGGVPNDEILSMLGRIRPELLLVFGSQPSGVPGVRKLIDMIREIGVNPTMNVMVSGGVFNRADGLWREVNADLTAKTAHQVIPLAESALPRTPTARRPGAPKKRRRRRSPLLAGAAG